MLERRPNGSGAVLLGGEQASPIQTPKELPPAKGCPTLPHVAPEILARLPEPMVAAPRWLIWREAPHPKKADKKRKVPMYSSGQRRSGQMDTEADLSRLTSIHDAMSAGLRHGASGIGFAVCGEGIGGLDLDGILDEQGELIPTHAGFQLAMKAEAEGVYMEVSPSGRGLRAFGPCDDKTAYSQDGVEYWGQRRFLTVTGRVWANACKWKNLNGIRSTLKPPIDERITGQERDGPETQSIITPKVLDELKSALCAIPSEERELWVKIGHALKTLPNDKGKALWLAWSATCPEKFDEADAERVWDTFNPVNTNHKAVFAEAQRNGWENPAKRKDLGEAAPSDDFRMHPGRKELKPTEFILDGFMPVGLSVIAGAWGAGKSTNLIPLLASAAHVAPKEWGFWPAIRRKLILVTEAPEQARDTIYSLSEEIGSAPWDEIWDWIVLFRARRLPAEALAKMLQAEVNAHTYELDNGFVVKPVIVLDTSAANIDLENESDNSQVSQAMAVLKQSLPGVSIVLVGHVPKSLARADVNDMTFRGAGAWEADAVATYFLVHDAATSTRFLAIRKCRFNPSYTEIEFGHEGGCKIIDTPWGDPQAKHYLHGVPAKSNGDARRAAQQEVRESKREENRERTRTERQERILSAIRHEVDGGRLVTRKGLHDQLGGKRELFLEAVNRLVESCIVTEHTIDRDLFGPDLNGPTPMILLPAEVDLELFLSTLDGQGSSGNQSGDLR